MSELLPPETKLEAVQLTPVNGRDNPLSAVSSTIFITPAAAEKESAVSIANASVTIIRPFEVRFSLPTKSATKNSNVTFTRKTSIHDCAEMLGARVHKTAPLLCELNLIELQ